MTSSRGLEEVSSRISEERRKVKSSSDSLKAESSKVINAINQNNTKVQRVSDAKSKIWNRKFKELADNLANQNIEHEKLEEFNSSLQEVYEDSLGRLKKQLPTMISHIVFSRMVESKQRLSRSIFL